MSKIGWKNFNGWQLGSPSWEGWRASGVPVLAGLEVQHEAFDLTTIMKSTGNLVAQINDKSGNNNHGTQGDSGRQPKTGVVTIGGRNALHFENDQLFVPANCLDDWDIFLIVKVIQGVGTNPDWWGNGGLYDFERGGLQFDGGSAVSAAGQLDLAVGSKTPDPNTDQNIHIVGDFRFEDHLLNWTRGVDPDLSQVRVDGTVEFDGPTTGGRTTTRDNLPRSIGKIYDPSGAYMPEMYYGGIYCYNRVLSLQERREMQDWVRAIWGITSV